MFILKGVLLNIYRTVEGVTKDGDKYGGDDRLQVLHQTTLRNGEIKSEVLEVNVNRPDAFKDKLNSEINIPVHIRLYKNSMFLDVIQA